MNKIKKGLRTAPQDHSEFSSLSRAVSILFTLVVEAPL